MTPTERFRQARDFLLAHREDYAAACAGFRWPELTEFNWALDWFDVQARGNQRVALRVVDESGTEEQRTFDELRLRSDRVAAFLREAGVRRGDRLLVMLGNVVPLWEITLAALKLGAVLCPATTLLARADLQDRLERGEIRHVITDVAGTAKFADLPGGSSRPLGRIVVGGSAAGWRSYSDAEGADRGATPFVPDGPTRATDPLLLYFTSGTTAKPKLVLHTHQSYPVGHLSTMYWIGLREGDVHWNISSPGWAKHAWSCVFAPWNAGATVFLFNQARFEAKKALAALVRHGVTTLCAPPTVWRMLILEDLKDYPVRLRELVGAGEPLNPEVIERVRASWSLTIRDGYGQTETTAQLGNSPGQPVKTGSMGRPLPGYQIALLGQDGRPIEATGSGTGREGELALSLRPAPLGLMAGYVEPASKGAEPRKSGGPLDGDWYRTSDVATRDADGWYWYVGRSDDVFKSGDYRVSPFELESALLEHPAVAEAAVVPSPDPIKLAVPKAFITLKPASAPTRATALALFRFSRERLAPFQRLRRLEFSELPKTISGKIRRVELRAAEVQRQAAGARHEQEFREEEFPELR